MCVQICVYHCVYHCVEMQIYLCLKLRDLYSKPAFVYTVIEGGGESGEVEGGREGYQHSISSIVEGIVRDTLFSRNCVQSLNRNRFKFYISLNGCYRYSCCLITNYYVDYPVYVHECQYIRQLRPKSVKSLKNPNENKVHRFYLLAFAKRLHQV